MCNKIQYLYSEANCVQNTLSLTSTHQHRWCCTAPGHRLLPGWLGMALCVQRKIPNLSFRRALKQEQTTCPHLMQMLLSTKGCGVSQGCDYKAEETHMLCLLITIRLVRQCKSPLYMLGFGSASHRELQLHPAVCTVLSDSTLNRLPPAARPEESLGVACL